MIDINPTKLWLSLVNIAEVVVSSCKGSAFFLSIDLS